MRKHGISEEVIKMVTYQNALDAYGQSGQFKESDWLNAEKPNQKNSFFKGNGILRGSQLEHLLPSAEDDTIYH